MRFNPSDTMPGTPLSMRERARLDAILTRVRQGDHYEVLGVRPGAAEAEVRLEYQQLRAFLDELLNPQRDLGEHRIRAEVVSRAVENAWRIIGNPRERIRYDTQLASLAQATVASPAPAEPSRDPSPPSAPRSTAARSRAQAMLAPHLLALLEAHLATLLGRPVDLRALAGGSLELRDASRAVRAAEEAERVGRWDEAVLWWHLAGLASPTDPGMILHAASALRRAGAPSAFEHYARAVQAHAVFDAEASEGPGADRDGMNSV